MSSSRSASARCCVRHSYDSMTCAVAFSVTPPPSALTSRSLSSYSIASSPSKCEPWIIHNAPRAFFFVASLPRRRASSSASIAPGSLAIAARAASSNARFHSAVHAHRLALSH
eukprot:8896-Pelagococcus_subviridis.AAC.1